MVELITISAILVKKITAEVAAQKVSHAARERLRRERREEQERNMQWKRAVFAEKMRTKTVAADASDADADAIAVVRK